MIVTVTLNPAIDQTIEVERFVEGDTNRVDSIRYAIGGKGIRVARVLKELGYEPLAMGFAPGDSGRLIENQLADSGIGTDFAFVPGETRTNITIVDREQHQHTVLSARGPRVDPADLDDLYARIRRRMRAETWLVIAGSLPPPWGGEVYHRMIEEAEARGAFSALDADGKVVRQVLDLGGRPSLLKLNAHELGRIFDVPTLTEPEVVVAARSLRVLGVHSVVVTRGAQGAIALTDEGDYRVSTPDVAVVSALGAGDAFLAGLLLGLRHRETWPQALARATAAGTAAAMVPGTGLCGAAQVEALVPRCGVEPLTSPTNLGRRGALMASVLTGISSVAMPLVVMLGGMDGGPSEQLLRRALEASALDTIDAAIASGRFDDVLLLVDRAPELEVPPGVTVEVDGAAERPFHYGRRLVRAIAEHHLDAVAYVGAGSAPLLGGDALAALVAPIAHAPESGRIVTNNRFSADCFALAPATLLARLEPSPAADNAVPRRLRDEHGVEVIELPRTLESQYNLDSPVDLLALHLTRRARPRLAAVLAEAGIDHPRVRDACSVFVDRTREVLVAGRVSSNTWTYLEREAACRVRLLAEERGMQAAGTDADGTARSLLGQWIAEAGAERAFGMLLPELCDAAFIDIRPALVHLGLRPSRADRFAADLGRADLIEDPGLRAIVEAANASPVPVVLGGHSLVGGVIQLLTQWAWDEHDAGRL